MANKKKHKLHGGDRPHGHFCRVCGEHKANEKFSGKGHAAHICKACASLPVAERNEMETLRKIEGMAFRHLNEQEIKWLRKKMDDLNPYIARAAKEAHGFKFPRYERNQIKKGLTAFSLELFIHGEIWDEYGDEVSVHALVELDDTGVLRRVDYNAPENERESEIAVEKHDARRFLKALIHQDDVLFWDEDLSDADPGDVDPYLDILPECRPGYGEAEDTDEEESAATEAAPPADDRKPIWTLTLELNNGEEKALAFYNQMHDAPQQLYWALMDWFDMEAGGEYDDDYGDEDEDEGDSDSDSAGE